MYSQHLYCKNPYNNTDATHTVSSAVLSLVLALCMVLLLCTVCLCYACVVDMGLRFRTVLCGLCGSSVVGGLSLSLFRGVVVGWALSFALLCALVYIDFWYILLSVSMSG